MRNFDYATVGNLQTEPKYAHTGAIGRRLISGFFKEIETLIGEAEPSSVLEVACGSGVSTQKLREILPAATLFEAGDYDEELVRATAARCPGIPLKCESIYSLEREDNSFDLVVALEVLEHLTDPEKALAELCRVSRRWVLASVPREPLWKVLNLARFKYVTCWGNTPGHLQSWSQRAFLRFLSSHLKVQAFRSPIPWTIVLAKVE